MKCLFELTLHHAKEKRSKSETDNRENKTEYSREQLKKQISEIFIINYNEDKKEIIENKNQIDDPLNDNKIAEILENEIFNYSNKNSRDKKYREKSIKILNKLRGKANISIRNLIRNRLIDFEKFVYEEKIENFENENNKEIKIMMMKKNDKIIIVPQKANLNKIPKVPISNSIPNIFQFENPELNQIENNNKHKNINMNVVNNKNLNEEKKDNENLNPYDIYGVNEFDYDFYYKTQIQNDEKINYNTNQQINTEDHFETQEIIQKKNIYLNNIPELKVNRDFNDKQISKESEYLEDQILLKNNEANENAFTQCNYSERKFKNINPNNIINNNINISKISLNQEKNRDNFPILNNDEEIENKNIISFRGMKENIKQDLIIEDKDHYYINKSISYNKNKHIEKSLNCSKNNHNDFPSNQNSINKGIILDQHFVENTLMNSKEKFFTEKTSNFEKIKKEDHKINKIADSKIELKSIFNQDLNDHEMLKTNNDDTKDRNNIPAYNYKSEKTNIDFYNDNSIKKNYFKTENILEIKKINIEMEIELTILKKKLISINEELNKTKNEKEKIIEKSLKDFENYITEKNKYLKTGIENENLKKINHQLKSVIDNYKNLNEKLNNDFNQVGNDLQKKVIKN